MKTLEATLSVILRVVHDLIGSFQKNVLLVRLWRNKITSSLPFHFVS